MWGITFLSSRFAPYLPEESQVNPGAYGFELALWLSQTLAQRGVVTSYPLAEDWGWLIEYERDGSEFSIGCGSRADAGEGYTGAPLEWAIFIRPHLSLRQRLRGESPGVGQELLARAIVEVLEAEGITVTYDDE